ncbi:protein DEHYDRATION-INDUCED 19 homolog 4-like [Euphorbia lathyris]|uniref:protein DEHYDRATION-INDUCED 19 homolog 4-like n=1 Tax=Euphorbia lathyris TaxID=212925 RepID=UPI003313A0B0
MASSDSWTSRLSTSSRRYHSRSDLYEETEVDEDLKAEFLCPFCAEDFDVVGLCCHIDEEHPVEAKNGVCPVCAKRVGMDIVGHITVQHGNFFKIQRRRRLRKGGSNTAFSLLRKELREGSLQSLLGGSSCYISSSNAEPDPLLSSFIFNPPSMDEPLSIKPPSSVEVGSSVKGSTNEEFRERKVEESVLSDKDQEEKTRRCKFVQGLLLSTILDDEV